MRTLLAGELTQAQRSDSDLYVKLEVQNGSGTWIDVGAALGTHWIINMTRSETIDSNVAAATFTIVARIGSASLMPLMSASALNVDDHGAYAPLLDIGRLIRANVATMAKGVALDVTKYREDFTGRIDEVSGAESLDDFGPITLTCSDLGAWLADLQIETADVVYGSDAGIPLETVLQTLLNNTIPGSDPAVTLVKQSSSFFAVQTFKQSAVKVLEALVAFVLDSTGEDIRYRYDANHVSQLTWFNPNRNRVSVDATFAPNQYLLRTLGVSLANVRNVIQMPFTDGASGTSGTATSQNVGSITKYRRRFNELPASALITTLAQAQGVVDAVANDLGGAPAEAQGDMPFFWPVQLYDRYTFQANSKQYDQDQTLTVVGVGHVIQNGSGVTTLTMAGRIIGAYAAWLTRIADGSIAPDSLTILRIESTESADGTTRTFTLTVGARVDNVIVHWRTVAITETKDTHDFSSTEALAEDALSPQAFKTIGRFVTFSLPQPQRGKVLAARFVPYYGVVEGESVPFTVDAAPPAINVQLHATRAGNLASISGTVAVGVSDTPGSLAVIETVLGVDTTLLTVAVTGTMTLDPAVQTALANRPIAAGIEKVTWRAEYTDVSGQLWKFGDVSALPALVSGSVTVVENTATQQATITASMIDPGGYLKPTATDALDVTKIGALTAHLTLKGVTTAMACTTIPVVGTTGDYTFVITLDPTRPIAVTIYRHYVDGSTDVLWDNALDSNKISDVVNASAVNSGATANVPVQFDNDTKIGVGFARYSLDGGATWTFGTVASDYSTLFTGVVRTTAVQSMILQGENAIDGLWGNQTTIQLTALETGVGSVQILRNTPDGTHDRFTWSATRGTMTVSTDGGSYGTPSASPWDVLNTSNHTYDWKLTTADSSTQPWHFDVGPGLNVPTVTLSIGNCVATNAGVTGPPYNQLDIAWTVSGMPAGTTYDVSYNNGGSNVDSATGVNATSKTFTGVTFASTPGSGAVTVIAQGPNGTLKTAIKNKPYLT